jgi:hypothetical protein
LENQNLKIISDKENGKITALLSQHTGLSNAWVVFYLEGSKAGCIAES